MVGQLINNLIPYMTRNLKMKCSYVAEVSRAFSWFNSKFYLQLNITEHLMVPSSVYLGSRKQF